MLPHDTRGWKYPMKMDGCENIVFLLEGREVSAMAGYLRHCHSHCHLQKKEMRAMLQAKRDFEEKEYFMPEREGGGGRE